MDTFFKALILVIGGTILLRIAGRKSISQMTVAQTVIMISIGSIIIQPIIEQSIWRTLLATAVFIGFLILMEYLQTKFNFLEKILTGESLVVIEDGALNVHNLKKLRFTVDQLEMRLRQQGIKNISDVKTATLEANGQLGYELKRYAQPVTIRDLEQMLAPFIQQASNPSPSAIFEEVQKKNDSRQGAEQQKKGDHNHVHH